MNGPIAVQRCMRGLPLASWVVLGLALGSCADEQMDVGDDPPAKGEGCEPADKGADADEDAEQVCAEGLVCESVAGGGDHVCAVPFEIHGVVFDALTGDPIEGALVAAMDETSAPVTDVAVTDADGRYVLEVAASRDENGELTDAKWRLMVSADGYQQFPAGVRPAIPVDATDAAQEGGAEDGTGDGTGGDGETETPWVVDNATTDVGLIPLPSDQAGGVSISGTVAGEDPAGTLVVAEGADTPAPRAVADLSGHYTIFNVPAGAATVAGYRGGLELEPATVTVADADLVDVDLGLVAEGLEGLGTVDGSVNIVNAPGGSVTSIVLIPVSVYNEVLERGPVPFGLRAPDPGVPFNVSSAFAIEGVPAGTYKVLAAFENDDLVRDPDESIAGTQIQEITVGEGQAVTIDASFKITEALEVVSPGADTPELVTSAPTFVWVDDSSENFYELEVFDALGEKVWEDLMVPRVTGSGNVEVPYGGDALTPGMYYQFRATSKKDTNDGPVSISRTEDLRGVFVFGEG